MSALQHFSLLFSLTSPSLVAECAIRGRSVSLPIALGGASGCTFTLQDGCWHLSSTMRLWDT
jgi:hypothetical protein